MSEDKYLIDGKFKDDEEGRAALAKAYGEVQGRAQKAEDGLKTANETIEGQKDAVTLKEFVSKDEQIVQFLKMRKEQKNGGDLKTPVLPENFDPLDIGTPGTPSDDFMKAQRKYDNAVLEQSLQKDFDEKLAKVTDSISDTHKNTQAKEDLHKELKKLGYDEDEIVKYEAFFADKKNATIENTDKIYRLLTGKDVAISPKILQEKGFPLSGIIPGATDLVEKSNPEAEKEKKKLMKYSNK